MVCSLSYISRSFAVDPTHSQSCTCSMYIKCMVALFKAISIHKVRAHEKKIATKSAEKNAHTHTHSTHTKYPIEKKEKGKRTTTKTTTAATKHRKFWLCRVVVHLLYGFFAVYMCVQYEFRHGLNVRTG